MKFSICKFSHVDPRDPHYGTAAGAIVREELGLALTFVIWVHRRKYLKTEVGGCGTAGSFDEVVDDWKDYIERWQKAAPFDVRLVCRERISKIKAIEEARSNLKHVLSDVDWAPVHGADIRRAIEFELAACGMAQDG